MDKKTRQGFGDYIESKKAMEGRGGADNYSYKELNKIAKEFLGIK